jgi:hypothetical protein
MSDIKTDPATGKRYKFININNGKTKQKPKMNTNARTKRTYFKKGKKNDGSSKSVESVESSESDESSDDRENYKPKPKNKSVNLLEASDKSETSNTDDDESTTDNESEKKSKHKKNKIIITRLGDDNYVRPKFTATDLLTREEIELRLKNFEKVEPEDVEKITPGTRIQYFDISDDKDFRYRPGGSVITNKYPLYIVLANGRKSWSVQLKTNILYKEKDISKIEAAFEEKLKEKQQTIDQLLHHIEKLKREIVNINKQNKQKLK